MLFRSDPALADSVGRALFDYQIKSSDPVRPQDEGMLPDNIFGTTPRYGDISWDGLPFTPEEFETITSIDKDAWRAELKLHAELFEKLAYHLPQELKDNMAKLEQRLNG